MRSDQIVHADSRDRPAGRRDILLAVVFTALVYGLAVWLDLHERLSPVFGSLERLQLDEVLIGAMAAFASAAWVARRRQRQLGQAQQARDEAAAALRESEARFAIAVLGSNDGVWDWELTTQRAYFSPRWKAMLGLPDVASSTAWLPLLHPDDHPRLAASIEPVLTGGADHFECEHRLRHADGRYRWMLARGVCVRDANGTPLRLAGSLSDVTQRVESMHALRDSEERFRTLFEHAADGIIVHDMSGMITAANPTACDSLGYRDEELVGQMLGLIVNRRDPEATRANLRALHEGRSVHFESEHRRKDGSTFPVEVHSVPFTWRDQQLVLGTVRNISARREAERALRDSESRHRMLFASLEAAVFVLQDGRCIDCNPAALHLLGRPQREAVLGRTLSAFSTLRQPDGRASAELLEAQLASAAVEGVAVCEWQGLRPDGETFLAELRLAPFVLGGTPLVQGIALDITQRKRDEETLRSTQTQLQFMIEQGSVGFWEWDLRTNEVVYFDSWRRQFGYDVASYAGTWSDWLAILHPDDHSRVATIFAEAMQGAAGYQTEFRLRHGDGSYRWVLSRATLICDAPGQPQRLLGAHIDISERKRLEEALQALNQDLEERVAARTGELSAAVDLLGLQGAALESVADAIAITDPHGRFLWVNSAFTSLTGYSADAVRGLTPALLRSGQHEAATYRRLWAAVRAGTTYRTEIVNRRSDGTTYPADLLISPVRDAHGMVTHLVVVQRDITDRRHAEAALRRFSAELEQRVAERTAQLEAVNRELESFSYSVSHDLRAPLRAVDGFSRALTEDYATRLDPEGMRLLSRIRIGANRMGQLIDDLLRLARLQRSQLLREPIDLSVLVHGIIAELRREAPDRLVDVQIAEGIVADGDHRLLALALKNLLDNAWKYSGRCPRARIEFGVAADSHGPVYFVRDNGAGFDMRYADKLFGAFQRLHGGDEFEGTGIGLAIVQRIINRHGGRIWAESAVDRGATFLFTLPAPRRTEAGEANIDGSASGGAPRVG